VAPRFGASIPAFTRPKDSSGCFSFFNLFAPTLILQVLLARWWV
jgi:hypothetical protein